MTVEAQRIDPDALAILERTWWRWRARSPVGAVAQDAASRDFSGNARFHDPFEGWTLDFVGGVTDVHVRVPRCLGETVGMEGCASSATRHASRRSCFPGRWRTHLPRRAATAFAVGSRAIDLFAAE